MEFDKGSVHEFLKSNDLMSRVFFKEDFAMRLYEQIPVENPETREIVGKVIVGYDAYEFDKVIQMTPDEFITWVGPHKLYNCKTWQVTFNNGFSLNN